MSQHETSCLSVRHRSNKESKHKYMSSETNIAKSYSGSEYVLVTHEWFALEVQCSTLSLAQNYSKTSNFFQSK